MEGCDYFKWTESEVQIIERTFKFLSKCDNSELYYNLQPRADRCDYFVQYCHGATGLVVGLSQANLLKKSPEIKKIVSKAAKLIFDAGPLVKGNCICHGNAGSGFALLKLYLASGDDEWLMYSRKFAMHAIDSWDSKSENGLFTGSAGLALYLQEIVSREIRWSVF